MLRIARQFARSITHRQRPARYLLRATLTYFWFARARFAADHCQRVGQCSRHVSLLIRSFAITGSSAAAIHAGICWHSYLLAPRSGLRTWRGCSPDPVSVSATLATCSLVRTPHARHCGCGCARAPKCMLDHTCCCIIAIGLHAAFTMSVSL